MRKLLFLILFFPAALLAETDEEALISHVKESIRKAQNGISSLPAEIFSIEGMSNPPVRRLLNNLCARPKTCYLEIGCWKGSTWVSALYGNEKKIQEAIAIEDWSEFNGPKNEFDANCKHYLKALHTKIFCEDCFKIDLSKPFDFPVTTYFYDGNHSKEAQEKAFTYFDPIFDDVFIAVVDDWKFPNVKQGTREAFKKLKYEILFEAELPSRRIEFDPIGFWNGLYVGVIRKTNLKN